MAQLPRNVLEFLERKFLLCAKKKLNLCIKHRTCHMAGADATVNFRFCMYIHIHDLDRNQTYTVALALNVTISVLREIQITFEFKITPWKSYSVVQYVLRNVVLGIKITAIDIQQC